MRGTNHVVSGAVPCEAVGASISNLGERPDRVVQIFDDQVAVDAQTVLGPSRGRARRTRR